MNAQSPRPQQTIALLQPVLDDLATVARAIREDQLDGPTPCADYSVRELLGHVIGWEENFAAAFASEDGKAPTSDAGLPDIPLAEAPQRIRAASELTAQCVAEGKVERKIIVGSPEGMPGEAMLLMMLGEYIAHGWDLATATGQGWSPSDEAVEVAHDFMGKMVQPEYRGGEHGMFAEEVQPSPEAGALERYLAFTGRDVRWSA